MTKDQSRFESDQAEYIKRKIAELRQENPRLSFEAAWNQLQLQSPALFVEVQEAT